MVVIRFLFFFIFFFFQAEDGIRDHCVTGVQTCALPISWPRDIIRALAWGYSSAGRALAWHARGQRFDPAYLHQPVSTSPKPSSFGFHLSPSSRGLGHRPFTAITGVRIPVGTPKRNAHLAWAFFSPRRLRYPPS